MIKEHQEIKSSNQAYASRIRFVNRSIISLFILIVSASFSFFIFSPGTHLEVEYELTIEADNSTSYEVLIPIPNIPHKIERKDGTESIRQENTERGDAYWISATGPMRITATGDHRKWTRYHDRSPKDYFIMGLQEDTNGDGNVTWRDQNNYSVHSNHAGNLSLTFVLWQNSSRNSICGTDHYIFYQGNISQGWNTISAEEEVSIWDGIGWFYVCWLNIISVFLFISFCVIRFILKRKMMRTGTVG